MAINKVPITGCTVKIKAVGGANTEAEIECIKGDLTIDWGTYPTDKTICHKIGTVYEKATEPEFDSTTVETWFDGDKADAFQTLLYDAHQGKGDFDVKTANGKEEADISFTFADADATVITIRGIVTKVYSDFTLGSKLGLKFDFQQTATPIVT